MAQFSNYTAIDAPADADIFLVYDDSAGATRKVTLQQLGDYIDTDQGFVTGPGSSTDNAVARFSGATGQIVQNSGVIIDDSNNVTGVATLTATTLAGTLSTATQNSVTTMTGLVTVGTIATGVWEATDIAVLHGGTGASTAADARTNLGLTIGTNVQAHSANLDALAADPLTATTAASTYLTQASAASTYLTQATAASTYLTIASAASTYQPLDADLTAIAALSSADGNFIVGSATGWVAESGATARTSLGLGNVENTALSTWAGSTSITTLGTITTGTWQGTPIANAYVAGLDQNVLTTSSPTFAGLTSTGEVTLGVDAVTNGVLNVPESLFVNLDSNNNSTNEKFQVGRNATGTGATALFTVNEDGTASLLTSFAIASDLTLASGSITSASGAISFGNENLSTTGTLASGSATFSGSVGIGISPSVPLQVGTGAAGTNLAVFRNAAGYGFIFTGQTGGGGVNSQISVGAAETLSLAVNNGVDFLTTDTSGNATFAGTLGVTGVFTNTSTGTSYFSQPTALVLGTTATSSNAQFYATKTYSAASGTDIASYFYYRQSAATTGGLIAVNGVGEATHTSGTVAELHGLRGLSQANSPGGTVTNVYAGYFWARNISATATITNAYSIYVANKTRSGTITNDWAIYSSDTAASYLAGSLRIGTTSAIGSEKLTVNGGVDISGELVVAGALNHDGTTVGFYGAAPVTQAAALTAANGSTVDATYGAEEAAVIQNLVTRQAEIETILSNLGLTA